MITMTKERFEEYLNKTVKKFHKDYECILLDFTQNGLFCSLDLFLFKATYPKDNYADIFEIDYRTIHGKLYSGDMEPTNTLRCSMSSCMYTEQERFTLETDYGFLIIVTFNPKYMEEFFKKRIFDLEMGS